MNLIDKITQKQINPNVPEFRVGDTVIVGWRVKEGKRERTQDFEGVVIARKGSGVSETFTVRRIASGVGVERIFPVNSPKMDYLKVVKKGKVRRVRSYQVNKQVGISGKEVTIPFVKPLIFLDSVLGENRTLLHLNAVSVVSLYSRINRTAYNCI